jgi:hypothetical protein
VAIDVFNETVVSFSEATKRLPSSARGGSIHVCALYRWAQAGLRSYDCQRAWLETIRVGGTTCTSHEALQRFFEKAFSSNSDDWSVDSDKPATVA